MRYVTPGTTDSRTSRVHTAPRRSVVTSQSNMRPRTTLLLAWVGSERTGICWYPPVSTQSFPLRVRLTHGNFRSGGVTPPALHLASLPPWRGSREISWLKRSPQSPDDSRSGGNLRPSAVSVKVGRCRTYIDMYVCVKVCYSATTIHHITQPDKARASNAKPPHTSPCLIHQ